MTPFIRRYGSWILPLILTGGSLVATYFHNDNVLTNRMTRSEVRQDDDRDRLERVEKKVDKIYDKLVEWERTK